MGLSSEVRRIQPAVVYLDKVRQGGLQISTDAGRRTGLRSGSGDDGDDAATLRGKR
jgi:hypothetical protein